MKLSKTKSQAKSAPKRGHKTSDYMLDTPNMPQSRLEDLVEKYQYFIFDCDGVLFHSNDEIGHAFKALKYIKKHPAKKEVFFFTNATTRTREELLKKI
jgi:hypothetical protein